MKYDGVIGDRLRDFQDRCQYELEERLHSRDRAVDRGNADCAPHQMTGTPSASEECDGSGSVNDQASTSIDSQKEHHPHTM